MSWSRAIRSKRCGHTLKHGKGHCNAWSERKWNENVALKLWFDGSLKSKLLLRTLKWRQCTVNLFLLHVFFVDSFDVVFFCRPQILRLFQGHHAHPNPPSFLHHHWLHLHWLHSHLQTNYSISSRKTKTHLRNKLEIFTLIKLSEI